MEIVRNIEETCKLLMRQKTPVLNRDLSSQILLVEIEMISRIPYGFDRYIALSCSVEDYCRDRHLLKIKINFLFNISLCIRQIVICINFFAVSSYYIVDAAIN